MLWGGIRADRTRDEVELWGKDDEFGSAVSVLEPLSDEGNKWGYKRKTGRVGGNKESNEALDLNVLWWSW